MSIRGSSTYKIEILEQVVPDTMGKSAIDLKHVSTDTNNLPLAGVWSTHRELQMAVPTSLDLTALANPQAAIAKDLFTDQEIRHLVFRHVSGGVVTIVCKSETPDDLATIVLSPTSFVNFSHKQGHPFGVPVKSIDLLASTGAATVEILIGTGATPA